MLVSGIRTGLFEIFRYPVLMKTSALNIVSINEVITSLYSICYTAYVQKLLGDTDNDLNPDAIASLAQDRSDWRQFVVACSAAE